MGSSEFKFLSAWRRGMGQECVHLGVPCSLIASLELPFESSEPANTWKTYLSRLCASNNSKHTSAGCDAADCEVAKPFCAHIYLSTFMCTHSRDKMQWHVFFWWLQWRERYPESSCNPDLGIPSWGTPIWGPPCTFWKISMVTLFRSAFRPWASADILCCSEWWFFCL